MNLEDVQLIDQFVNHRDESAFEDLVARYVDVAYAATITCLGKDDLAQDACQMTFVELSRKAHGLGEKVKLGGWVYTTARNMARKIQRGEMRRVNREQSFVDQMKLQQQPEVDWSQLAPEIHEALEQIKPED
ncbi:MAG: sigma factor [Pontiella sp.]